MVKDDEICYKSFEWYASFVSFRWGDLTFISYWYTTPILEMKDFITFIIYIIFHYSKFISYYYFFIIYNLYIDFNMYHLTKFMSLVIKIYFSPTFRTKKAARPKVDGPLFLTASVAAYAITASALLPPRLRSLLRRRHAVNEKLPGADVLQQRRGRDLSEPWRRQLDKLVDHRGHGFN